MALEKSRCRTKLRREINALKSEEQRDRLRKKVSKTKWAKQYEDIRERLPDLPHWHALLDEFADADLTECPDLPFLLGLGFRKFAKVRLVEASIIHVAPYV